MKYYEIKIDVSELGIEPMLAALIALEIDTVEVSDPNDALFMSNMLGETDYLSPNDFADEISKTPGVVVYAANDETAEDVIDNVRGAVSKLKTEAESGLYGSGTYLGTLDISVRLRDDEEWKDNWKEFLKPGRLG